MKGREHETPIFLPPLPAILGRRDGGEGKLVDRLDGLQRVLYLLGVTFNFIDSDGIFVVLVSFNDLHSES